MSQVTLIGLGGAISAGKTTAAEGLVERGWQEYTFATPLKKICQTAYLLSPQQLYGTLQDKETVDPRWGVSPREIMQFVGTELFRNGQSELLPHMGANFWVEHFRHFYRQFVVDHPGVPLVVSDVRFPNEAEAIRELGGTTVYLHRPQAQESRYNSHVSEIGKNAISWDHTVINDGTVEELVVRVLQCGTSGV